MAVGGNNSGGGSAGGIKAGSAYVSLYIQNHLTKGLSDAARTFHNFGNTIGSIGRKMALGGVAGLTPLIGSMSTLNDIAKQGAIAKSIGLTSEQFTGIAGVAKTVGEDTREFIESLVTMGKLGTDAAAGTEQASQAFASMGLNANEFIKLRADEQFFAVFEALSKMEDPLQRTRALMLAFGEDGGKYLLPLLGKSAEELKGMAKGFAITTDDMKAATGAQQAYIAATTALSKAWQSVSIAAAPIVKIIAEGIASAVTPFREFVNANKEAVVGLALAAGGVTAVGIGLMILGPAIKVLAGSWMLFTGAVAVGKAVIAGTMALIAAPILLIPAALAAAGAAWLAFTSSGRETVAGFAGAIEGAFGPSAANLREGWSLFIEAVSAGELETAFQIAAATMRVEWVRFTNFLESTWEGFTTDFVTSWKIATRMVGEELNGLAIKMGFNNWKEMIGVDEPVGLIDGGKPDPGAWGQKPNAIKFEQKGGIENQWQRFGAWLRGGKVEEVKEVGGNVAEKLLGVAQEEVDAAKALRDAAQAARAAREAEAVNEVNAIKDRFRNRNADADWFGGGGDWGGDTIRNQIADIAQASRGSFGGSANVGMFGDGSVGKQIADNTKKSASKLDELLNVVRHNSLTTGIGLTVEAGG